MKAKATVNLAGCSAEIGYAMAVMESIYRRVGAEFIVTSANDSHTAGLHPRGRAFDCRTRHLTRQIGDAILTSAKKALGPLGFQLVDERTKPNAPHFHCEYDPRDDQHFLQIVP